MRESCISHPAHERLVILREWQLRFCEGNHCAAMLLGFFEYWHGIRLEMSEKAKQHNAIDHKHGEAGTQDESLYQFHTEQQIQAGLLGMYGREAIRAGRRLLVEKGAISEHKNPNPRYAFDATIHFLFYPKVCQEFVDTPKSADRCAENGASCETRLSSHSRYAETDHTDAETGLRSPETGTRSAVSGTRSGVSGTRSADFGRTSPKITSEITSEIIVMAKSRKKPRDSPTRATTFPADFSPTETHKTFAMDHGLDLTEEVSHFSHHHQAKGSTFVSWEHALWTWLHNAGKMWRPPGGASNGAYMGKQARLEAINAQAALDFQQMMQEERDAEQRREALQ